jgi:cell division protein FtsI/penicillin-binding protein 2
MKTEYASRYVLLGTLFTVMAALIFGQHVALLLDNQRGEVLDNIRKSHLGSDWTIYPPRGLIFDRKGQLLAGNQIYYEVGVDYTRIGDAHQIALASNVFLGLDYYQVKVTLENPITPKQVYFPLNKRVEKEKVDGLKAFLEPSENDGRDEKAKKAELAAKLSGLELRPYLERIYPEKSLASNLLGYVGHSEDGTPVGVFGVEGKYDEVLAGLPLKIWVPNDPRMVKELPAIPEGTSLVLTIDREVQAAVEKILDEEVEKSGSDTGVIVVLDPRTGEILALASTPRIDISRYWEYNEQMQKKKFVFNRGIGATYEPGSVFKPLTMAAAFDKGVVNEKTTYLDRGAIEVGGNVIYNWDRAGHGKQTMQGCLQYSLNVCLAWVATQLGSKDFYNYMQAFGLGQATGVDMAGEMTGILKLPGDADWTDGELGVNSFGQGVSATPIQMASALAALANDGKMMTPHIVRAIIKDGKQYMIEPRVSSIPVSAETARTLTEILARSLEAEASAALVEGYRVAGKTGTAEIAIPGVGYTSGETNASFAGWGPVDDPRFLVYIWLEKPSTSIWGSEVAAPIFPKVVQQLTLLMNIPPDRYRKAGN